MSVYRWSWEDGASPEFDSRQAAEDWMGAEWQRLLESGVLAATLAEDDRALYRMKLTAE